MAGRRRALIVANGEYENAGLQQLASPAADADALAGVLADRAVSDFEVRVVRNEASHVVQGEIEDLCAEGRPDDVLLLHFSCHGLKDDSGGLYFAARNTRPDRLRSTAVPADFVQQCIRQSRSRSIVLLLDCCYGGAFGQGVAVRASGDANVLDSFRGGRGRAVITASNSIEYAFEGARLASDEPARPSVFTSALVEGLRTGEADRDEDGWIALGELYEYLFDRVRERNPKQTPSRDIEMQGELYLAKSRRRRIKPSPIPPDLRGAIEAENPFTRLGAVAELRRRLSSDNLPVALGAFEALKTMAATDIEHVAAAASDALAVVLVRVDSAAVRLAAPPGETASAALRVVGPPVAREVRFEASHEWIRVTEVPSGAQLSVTAGEAGTRHGKVVAAGPTGEVVVSVEIETLPAPEPAAGREAGSWPVAVAEVRHGPESAPKPAGRGVPAEQAAPEAGSTAAPGGEPATETGGAPGSAVSGAMPGSVTAAGVMSGQGAEAGVSPGSVVSGAALDPEAGAGAVRESVSAADAVSGQVAEAEGAPGSGAVLDPGAGTVPGSVTAAGAAPGPAAAPEPAAAAEVAPGPVAAAEPRPGAEARVERTDGTPSQASAVDPVGGFAGVTAIAGAVIALAGLPLSYRYGGNTLGVIRPGMDYCVVIVAVGALLAGALTLAPRTRACTGPALLFGIGLGSLFGLVRFLGDTGLLPDSPGEGLNAGYAFELLGHIAFVVAGACALAALRRNATVALRAGRIRGWVGWLVVLLGVTVAGGWLAQFGELSGSYRAAAYFVIGAVLAVVVPVVAMVLRPARVGHAVLGAGTVGLLGALAPTSAEVAEYSSTVMGQVIAVAGVVALLVVAVILMRRNQPIER